MKLFISESAVAAEIGILKNRKLPPLRAANNGRFACVKGLKRHIFMCNSGGTVDFIHPVFFAGCYFFI